MYLYRNFVLLEAAGAELVFFSPLVDEELPADIVGLYIGGGHPECYSQRLSENKRLISSVQAFAAAGGVVYAEGGGLLYLSKSIQVANELPTSMGKSECAYVMTVLMGHSLRYHLGYWVMTACASQAIM